MPIRRRRLLGGLVLGALALEVAACARPTPPRPDDAVALPPHFDRWNQESHGMLSDVLASLRTFDVFQAFRVSTASASSLAWDPPTSAAWDEATHVARGLRGRAEQLFQAITLARIDPSLWREQRARADAAHDLLDLGDALAAYADQLGPLPPGDANGALRLLEKAWTTWDTCAMGWGTGRGELVTCGR